MVYFVHNYIFGFDVSMNDSRAVQLIDSWADLFDQACNFTFGHGLIFPEKLKELSSGDYFKNNVDILIVIEATVHFNDMRMIK
jgi:hypothetical protein